MHRIAVVNQKGGVGKTAITKELAAALAQGDPERHRAGRRVLMVDLDPQGHLTDAIGVPNSVAPATLANALLGRWSGELGELVTPYRPNLDVIATNEDMFLLEPDMYGAAIRSREYRLSRLLDAFDEAYDYCLIDCPPSLAALTDNALAATRRRHRSDASGGILIPVQAEDSSLKALTLLFDQVRTVEEQMRIELEIIGLVINLYDGRRGRIATSTRAALLAMDGIEVVAEIGDRTAIKEGWRLHVPVSELEPKPDVAEVFRALAERIDKKMTGAVA